MRSRDKGIWLAIIIPVIGLLPMFGGGLPNAADAPFHAHRIFALARLIEAGDLYPRWAPYFHLGYGYPVFTYYAPGATHIGAWLHLLGIDVVAAYKLTTAIAWYLGSAGVWLLARRLLPASAALLACVLWVYAPSRFFEFWWQGSLAQIVATSFIPLVFYGILRARRHPDLRNGLWIALPFAAIVLTHTPTTYIVCIFVLPLCLAAAFDSRAWRVAARRLIIMGGGLALGAGLSAIFWLPVAAELQYVKIGGELRDTVSFLSQSFLSLDELFSFPQVVDSNDATLLMSRTLGPLGAVLSLLGALALLLRRRYKLAALLLAGLVAALLLTLEQSLDLWLLMPGFRNLRFPERIIRMAALMVALLGASSVLLLPGRWRTAATLLLSALVVGQALPLMRPRDDDRVWKALSAKDEIEMEFSERNWGTTAYNEFRPIWGESTSFDLPRDLERYVSSPLQIHVYAPDFERRQDTLNYQYQADNQILVSVSGEARTIRLRQFYMPGWQLTVDGEAHPFRAGRTVWPDSTAVAGGRTSAEAGLCWHVRAACLSAWISLASIALCLLIWWRSQPSPRAAASADAIATRVLILAGGGLIAFALINAAWLQDNLLRVRNDDGRPVYMQREAEAVFDDAIALLGYSLNAHAIGPGEPLEVRLYWRRLSAPTAEYRPVVQLVDLTVAEAWAVSQPLNFEGGRISALGPGQFMSDGHKLTLLDDAPPYVGRISVQLRRKGGDQSWAALPDGSTRYLLPEVIRIQVAEDAFEGRSQGIDFGGSLTLHCIETTRSGDDFAGALHWQVLESPPLDLHHFVHGLGAEQALLAQNDGEPLDGQYPTSYWRAAQYIRSEISMKLVEGVALIAFGLYNPEDGKRVPVTADGQRTDRILLSPENRSC